MNKTITNPTQFIPFDDEKIEYMGRIRKTDSSTEIYWSGSSIKIVFVGTSVNAVLQDEKGDNYFNIIVDDNCLDILRPSTSKKKYELAQDLRYGKHTVQLFKRSEWTQGKTHFYGFYLNRDAEILTVLPKEKHIEFYGDSITCGYVMEDFSGADSSDPIYTNNYKSYAALTARYFNAKYSCIARSGDRKSVV